jgi:formate hydrogenlyase transcriptional activator
MKFNLNISESETVENQKELSILLSFSRDLSSVRDKKDLIGIINLRLREQFFFDDFLICTVDEQQQLHRTFFYNTDLSKDGLKAFFLSGENLSLQDGFFDRALNSKGVTRFEIEKTLQENKDAPAYLSEIFRQGIREMIALPLVNQRGRMGVFFLLLKNPNIVSEESLRILEGLSYQLAITIVNIVANEEIQQQLIEINQYKQQLLEENLYLKEESKLVSSFSEIIGSGPVIQKIFHLISQVAPSDSTVLLLGETGTGKELIARAIHNASSRKDKLMIKVNCAALPPNLIESELFGHEKGSFTGSVDRRIGKFELANKSTLFLDEIGELSLELQVKLLRVLQEREIERVGGRSTIKVDVRIIAATNRNLYQEVEAGRFRSDLFYRLNVFPITLPALRERKEDIAALTSHFISVYARNAGKKITGMSQNVIREMMNYSWPGNVRELQHLVERSVLLANGSTIKEIHLPNKEHISQVSQTTDFIIKPLEQIEKEYILKVVKSCGGRISGPHGAANKLGLPSTTLISKMQRLGIKKDHFIEKK